MTCNRCGAKLSADSRYCYRCGVHTTDTHKPTTESAAASVAPPDLTASTPPSPTFDLAFVGAAKPTSRSRKGHSLAALRSAAGNGALVKTDVELSRVKRFLLRANLYRAKGEYDQAVDKCALVLKIQPHNASAHSLLGDIYRDQGKFADAAEWYRMALEIRHHQTDAAKLAQVEAHVVRHSAEIAPAPPKMDALPWLVPHIPSEQSAAQPYQLGTQMLMGISPRSWLRALTLSSAGFVVLMVLVFAVVKHRHPDDYPIPRTLPLTKAQPYTVSPSAAGASPSGPSRQVDPAAPATPGSFGSPTSYRAGTGMRPDLPRPAPPTTPNSVPPIAQPTGSALLPGLNDPTTNSPAQPAPGNKTGADTPAPPRNDTGHNGSNGPDFGPAPNR